MSKKFLKLNIDDIAIDIAVNSNWNFHLFKEYIDNFKAIRQQASESRIILSSWEF